MGVLNGLNPERVFYYFEEISKIPRGFGNEKQISDYLRKFAQDRGLECIQDEWNNIIIIKEAASGYEGEEAYILQGHMDMVTVKNPDCDIDMTREPIRLCVRDGRICAEGTSLGGDDGIAVAYILALLDSPDIKHPRLELVITTEEETGLTGAKEIDLSMLRGRQLINLDNEEEGVIITSCAGGARVDVYVPVKREQIPAREMQLLSVTVKGLLGGHSGTEIDKGRGNANCLLGHVLHEAAERSDLWLVDLQGGQADNAIPREARATLVIPTEYKDGILTCIEKETNNLRENLRDTDPDFYIECVVSELSGNLMENTIKQPAGSASVDSSAELLQDGRESRDCLTPASVRQVLSCLTALPNGVTAMSMDVDGLVQTSLNLGVMTMEQDTLHLTYAVRSSVDEEKEELCQRMQMIAGQSGASVTIRSSYPGWAYRKNSPLRDKAAAVYESMYGGKPKLLAIHAGLECGLLASKIPGLDCISIGPDMSDVHTPQESISIESVARVWEFLLAILAKK